MRGQICLNSGDPILGRNLANHPRCLALVLHPLAFVIKLKAFVLGAVADASFVLSAALPCAPKATLNISGWRAREGVVSSRCICTSTLGKLVWLGNRLVDGLFDLGKRVFGIAGLVDDVVETALSNDPRILLQCVWKLCAPLFKRGEFGAKLSVAAFALAGFATVGEVCWLLACVDQKRRYILLALAVLLLPRSNLGVEILLHGPERTKDFRCRLQIWV